MSSLIDEELKTKVAELTEIQKEGINRDLYDEYSTTAKLQRNPSDESNIQLRAEIIKKNKSTNMTPEEYDNLKKSLDSIENSIKEKKTLLANEEAKFFKTGRKKSELQNALKELETIQTKLKVLLALYAAPITKEEEQELIKKMDERYNWPIDDNSENKKTFEENKELKIDADQYHSSAKIKPYDTIEYRVSMRKNDFNDNEKFYEYLKNIEANVNNTTELSLELKNKFTLFKRVYAPKYYYKLRYFGGKRKTRKNKKAKKGKSRKSSRK